MSKGIGIGGVVLVAGIVWVIAQGETENPGATNRATSSAGQVVAGVIRDAGVVVDQARLEAGGIASDLGGAVEGQGTDGLPAQPQLPVQVQPEGQG